VFLRDRQTGVTQRLAEHAAGDADETASLGISADGRYVAMALGPNAGGGPYDVWVLDYRASHSADELSALVSKLRVYTISDQDDAGPWIRREFPALHYIAMPSTPDGDQYASATWTGISGDLFYKNAPGADFSTFTTDWAPHVLEIVLR